MSRYSLSHLSDTDLLHSLHASISCERASTADVLANIAEVDERKLYLTAAYASMYAYCIGELRYSEDAAYKRIQAARAARVFPAILPAVAEGRLHLTGVGLLAPHLTTENADDLLAAASGKTKAQVEQLLAERFPRPDLLTLVQPFTTAPQREGEPAPAQVGVRETTGGQLAPGRDGCEGASAGQLAPAQVPTPTPRDRVAPTAPERYAVQLTISKAMHDKLRYAQALLGHQVPAGEIAEVFDRALDALIGNLERDKFAATSRPRGSRHASDDPRHIPAEVRRAVWQRDSGRCTFVSADGHRCEATSRLEFDHLEPVAKGGRATPSNLRLRCRAHNQHAAAQAFGAGFMDEKRRKAREAAAERARVRAEEREIAARAARARAELEARGRAAAETMPWLRRPGPRGRADHCPSPAGS